MILEDKGYFCIASRLFRQNASGILWRDESHICPQGAGSMTILRSWKRARLMTHHFVDALLAKMQPVQAGGMHQVVARIREIMKQSISSPPSLFQHANAFGISPGHLSWRFAELTGQTFQQKTRRLRMEKAKELPAETKWKIATIAAKPVSTTPQDLSEFRKECGVTPGRYRKARFETGS